MSGETAKLTGPDLEKDGIAPDAIQDGAMFLGHAQGEGVLLVRRGERVLAVGATCTHYGGPLSEGVLDGTSIRCPWHHACFDLETGDASAAPAFAPIACFDVAARDGRLFVIGKKPAPAAPPPIAGPSSVVIVGGGAAGFAAAEMLRRRGFAGSIVMLSADVSTPYDRPNVSKDYLAGTAPEEWMPLRGEDWYREQNIDLRLRTRVASIDVAGKRVLIEGGGEVAYDALVLATGAEAIRLAIPGADRSHVHVLRSLADSRAIIERAGSARRAVVIGASFIGLEAAAALRARGLEVHVVAPDERPLARVLGAAIGGVIEAVHRAKGVVFHLGRKPASIEEGAVVLDDGTRLDADLVVMGVGVRPLVALAEGAGLKVDRGIVVDATLRTSAPEVWAAGDAARWPDRRFGNVRIEHWVVAQRQGQTVAHNILAAHAAGSLTPFASIPFFWSNHFDAGLSYVGHAESWDAIDIDGDLEAHDFAAAFRKGGRTLAVATMGRDHTALEAEVAMEREDEAALQRIVPSTAAKA
jgi:NADPH-dependent 2,4-dienoyl-CoA reductase/sulfur reductase-like enzyme/nitrite reductase/ring-hydroxylating ferredoxin subunit